MFDRRHVHITANHESDLFSIRTQCNFGDTSVETSLLPIGSIFSDGDVNLDLGGIVSSMWQKIDLAIITETEITILCDRQKSNRILFEMSDRLRRSLLSAVYGKFPHVQ